MSNAVSYELQVGGGPASAELLAALVSLEVEDHADVADMVRMRLAIGVRPDAAGWTHLDAAIFTRLANVRVAAAAGAGPSEPLIDAYVIDVRAELSSDPGRSTLEVVAMDATALMSLEEKVRAWPDMADSAIAAAIFGEYGLTPDVQEAQPVRQEVDAATIQRGTDMQLLRRLAERNGFELHLEPGGGGSTTAHFHPPRLDEQPQGTLSVNLGPATNVDSFRARHDMLKPAVAEVRGLDVGSGQEQPADATSSAQTPLGGASTVPAERPRRVLLSGTGMAQTGELQTLAQAVVDRSSFAITAEGELRAAAYGGLLRAKKPVLVRGAGTEFSGTYYVERVRHVFDSNGYVQRFRLRRNAGGLTRSERFQGDDALPPQEPVRV